MDIRGLKNAQNVSWLCGKRVSLVLMYLPELLIILHQKPVIRYLLYAFANQSGCILWPSIINSD